MEARLVLVMAVLKAFPYLLQLKKLRLRRQPMVL
jgi:hypothetical protein